MNTEILVNDLKQELNRQDVQVEHWMGLEENTVITRPANDSWSIAEIARHLLLTGGHYERHLRKVLEKNADRFTYNPWFQPAFWGQRGVSAMQPKESGKIPFKMPTLTQFEPTGARQKHISRLHEIIEGLYELLDTYGLKTDLNRILVPSTITPFLRFRAGDAFRFAIAHNKRHLLQGERALERVKTKTEVTGKAEEL